MKISECVELYLSYLADKSENTIRNYKIDLNQCSSKGNESIFFYFITHYILVLNTLNIWLKGTY